MLRRWLAGFAVPALVLGTLLTMTQPASAGIVGLYLFGRAVGGFNGYYAYPYWGSPYYGYYGNGYYGYPYGGPYYGYYPAGNYYPVYTQPPLNRGYTSFYPSDEPNQMPKNAALVEVRVPPTAQVWFDGDKTQQTGMIRDFITPELKPDRTYHYTLKARWSDNGEQVEKTRKVRVAPGARVMVDFLRPPG